MINSEKFRLLLSTAQRQFSLPVAVEVVALATTTRFRTAQTKKPIKKTLLFLTEGNTPQLRSLHAQPGWGYSRIASRMRLGISGTTEGDKRLTLSAGYSWTASGAWASRHVSACRRKRAERANPRQRIFMPNYKPKRCRCCLNCL